MNNRRTETYDFLMKSLSPEHRLLLQWYAQVAPDEEPSGPDASDGLRFRIAILEEEFRQLLEERDEALAEAARWYQHAASQAEGIAPCKPAVQQFIDDARSSLQTLPDETAEGE